MGLLEDVAGPVAQRLGGTSTWALVAGGFASFLVLSVVLNVFNQLLFKNPNEPPVVFHWFPVVGSTVTYGMEPFKFFKACRDKYGDVFTFILLGRKTTVFLGTRGNDFILNGKHQDLNAEQIYNHLTAPIFGKDVVYDCPNSKLMEQKKFVKFGLTQDALRSHVHLIAGEVQDYTKKSQKFKGQKGSFEVVGTMSEVVIYTASRSLQGKEVRDKLNAEFAGYFHDLDMGFSPINFMFPWAPLPHNRKRDIAHQKMIDTYTEIIQSRRKAGTLKDSEDMIWNLMSCKYKDGTHIPDHEAAGMMIALLMGGQHSSSSTISWILLHLAVREDLQEELFQEQKEILGKDLPEMTYDDISRLKLHSACIKETLRIHTPIHSIMRKVTRPMPVESTPYTIPAGHVLLSSPGYSAKSEEHFPNADSWEPHRWDDGMNVKSDEDEEKVDWGYGMVSKASNSPYLPFGAGRHRCIGEQFAYVQLTTILAMLVREFKFRGVGGSKKIVETDYSSMFSRPQPPATIEWERRNP